MRDNELVQLKDLQLFRDMEARHFESLLDAALMQQFPAGVVLIHEGTHADFLHVLVDGLVEIFSEQGDSEWGISLLKPVSTFILAAVVVDQTYLNSARTLSPCLSTRSESCFGSRAVATSLRPAARTASARARRRTRELPVISRT